MSKNQDYKQERLDLDNKLFKMCNNLLSAISCLITTSIFIIISMWINILL